VDVDPGLSAEPALDRRRLDAFGDDLTARRRGEMDETRDDGLAGHILIDAPDETYIDLDEVGPEFHEVVEIRDPSFGVVDGESNVGPSRRIASRSGAYSVMASCSVISRTTGRLLGASTSPSAAPAATSDGDTLRLSHAPTGRRRAVWSAASSVTVSSSRPSANARSAIKASIRRWASSRRRRTSVAGAASAARRSSSCLRAVMSRAMA
jgi:hypothetical protein